MDEHCKDCIYLENVKKDVAEIKVRINTIELELDSVKEKTTINEVQTKMVFDMLKDIKSSVEKVSTKIDHIEQRPGNLQYTIAAGVIVAIVMLGIKFLTGQ